MSFNYCKHIPLTDLFFLHMTCSDVTISQWNNSANKTVERSDAEHS